MTATRKPLRPIRRSPIVDAPAPVRDVGSRASGGHVTPNRRDASRARPAFSPHLATAIALAATCFISPAHVAAQSLEEATELFAHGGRSSVEAGIQTLGMIGDASALQLLLRRIDEGLPPDLLDTAVLTLAAIGDPAAEPTLTRLAAHRRPEIRAAAMGALAVTNGDLAFAALVEGLSDGESAVRRAAATGLGQLGRPQATPHLFAALDKGNIAASSALGKVTPPAETARLVGYIGKLPFHHLAPALLALLQRKAVPDTNKLLMIQKIAELETPEARGFLHDAVASSAESLSGRVRRAALQASRGGGQ